MEIIFSGFSVSDTLIFSYKNYTCINLYYIHNKYATTDYVSYAMLSTDNELANIVTQFRFNTSYNILFETIRVSDYISLDFNKLLCIYIALFSIFQSMSKLIQIKDTYAYVEQHIPAYISMTNKLLIRPGVIELRACNLTHNPIIIESLTALSTHIYNDTYVRETAKKGVDNWLSICHDRKNYEHILSDLMTNAGFYISDDVTAAIDNFYFFKDKYTHALVNADYIMQWPFVNCYALNILNEKKKVKPVEYINLTDTWNLVSLFDHKSILFVTPFKELVDSQYTSGNLYKLRRSHNLTSVRLDTIEAFLTTYPNRKHNSFIETYQYYVQEIDAMFSKHKYDIFTCSCGCYGIILCEYVYRTYNVTSVYVGNAINRFFGISFTTATHDVYYVKSDLHTRYKDMDKIENNIYGFR